MADKKKAILLRIPQDLWDCLNRWAGDELRSLTGQIEYVRREAVRKRAGSRETQGPPEDSHAGGSDQDGQGCC